MSGNEDFWEDLLSHIRQRILVPVVGPDLGIVDVGNGEQTFSSLIGQRLAERYDLNVAPGVTTMGRAVASFLRERGRDEVWPLYRVINDVIAKINGSPGDPLRDLAAITDIRLLVSTTPDRLLAQAVNDARYGGRRCAHELSFSPSQSTTEQARNVDPPAEDEAVVLALLAGQRLPRSTRSMRKTVSSGSTPS